MSTALHLPTDLPTQSVNRVLRLDGKWRYVIAAYKAHGSNPDCYRDHTMAQLGANYVVRGRGTYTDWDGRSYELRPGVFFHRLPGHRHSTWIDPASDYAEWFVVLDPATSANLLDLGLVQRVPVMDVGFSPIMLEEFEALCQKLRRTESELPSSALMVEVLRLLSALYERARQQRSQGSWDRIVSEACVLLERDLEHRLPLESVAQQLGVAYPTFRKEFRRLKGTSPGEYRIRCRLERACAMLPGSSVKQVAAELGYCDPFTFSAQFKRYIGMSPKQFQRSMERKT